MNEPELNFKGNDPGAVRYGNFINYYQFHSPESRLKLIPVDIWNQKTFHGLDVGCNAGNLTASIHELIHKKSENCEIVGVDIDPILIERAREKFQNEHIKFLCFDFMEETGRIMIKDYLKKREIQKFDIVFCFSITMWIHLNYGDSGLKDFLSEVSSLGNILVIEPQPWRCYKNAVKRMKRFQAEFPYYKQLQVRETVEDSIEQFLTDNCKVTKIYESEQDTWGRKLLIFKCS